MNVPVKTPKSQFKQTKKVERRNKKIIKKKRSHRGNPWTSLKKKKLEKKEKY